MSFQLTFDSLGRFRKIKAPGESERKVISLINYQLTQTDIAFKLNISRARVNQIVKSAESHGFLKRANTQPGQGKKRNYNYFYELSSAGIEWLGKDQNPQEFTACRMHHFRRKYKIVRQSSPPVKDERASYLKSWKLRGGSERYKYWYPGRAGIPSVTLDVHPKTIVAYVDKGQSIPARSAEEATGIGWKAISEARDKFIAEQSRFGAEFIVEEIGEPIGKVHAGFVMHESNPVAQQRLDLPDWWKDKSVEKELGPGYTEAESDNPAEYTQLESGIMTLQILPEAMQEFNKKLDAITEQGSQSAAMLQGSITTAQQNDNILKFLSKIMDEMQAIRNENAELKKRLGMP